MSEYSVKYVFLHRYDSTFERVYLSQTPNSFGGWAYVTKNTESIVIISVASEIR
jgi:hypothetical protein